jgi:NhaP-type Na+/H+ or K+/H+ antiporter
MIMIYVALGTVIEKFHCSFGHEASFVVMLGGLASFIAYFVDYTVLLDGIKFNNNVFFYFCLPPIVFASGFNMKRKIFFENFGSVIIFGVFSTIIQFILFSCGLYLINYLIPLSSYNF